MIDRSCKPTGTGLRGFTLTELLVAMSIGSVLLLTVLAGSLLGREDDPEAGRRLTSYRAVVPVP